MLLSKHSYKCLIMYDCVWFKYVKCNFLNIVIFKIWISQYVFDKIYNFVFLEKIACYVCFFDSLKWYYKTKILKFNLETHLLFKKMIVYSLAIVRLTSLLPLLTCTSHMSPWHLLCEEVRPVYMYIPIGRMLISFWCEALL